MAHQSRLNRRRVLFGGAALGALAIAGLARSYRRRHEAPIPAHGGRPLHLVVAKSVPFFRQRDPRWGSVRLGPTDQTLAESGCLICSLAMGISALGLSIDPPTLNRSLLAHKGFTDRGWVIWEALSAATGNAIEARVHHLAERGGLDEGLERGELPVIKFMLASGASHWVLVVGKEGDEYLVKDPLLTDDAMVPLRSRTSLIHAARLLSRRR